MKTLGRPPNVLKQVFKCCFMFPIERSTCVFEGPAHVPPRLVRQVEADGAQPEAQPPVPVLVIEDDESAKKDP